VKAKIESTRDSKGRANTFHMMEGSDASVENWRKAENTPDAHVEFIGHATYNPNNPDQATGIQLSDGASWGKNGSQIQDFKANANPDAAPPMVTDYHNADSVSASSVAIFGCNSYDLGSQYPMTTFTGVQGDVDLNTLEAAGLGLANAQGGQAGNAAANAAIANSPFSGDSGADVETDDSQ
jgi:hypothetical protein